MQAAAIMEHRDRIIKAEDEENFLPVSVIYGPNGGGKSNVLEALHTLDAKVLRPNVNTRQELRTAIAKTDKVKKIIDWSDVNA